MSDSLHELMLDLVDWSKPEPRNTRNGQKFLKIGTPDKEFWKLWRERKDEIRDLGISASKDEDSGDFKLKWWTDEEEDIIYTKLPELTEEDVFDTHYTRNCEAWRLAKHEDVLKPYQVPAARTLFEILLEDDFAIDASDTGLGKTYSACAVAANLGLNVCVVCPANVVTKWTDTLMDVFEVEPEFVMSYDKLRTGNTEYVDRVNGIKLGKSHTKFKWNVVAPLLVIFDEIHMCSALGSKNAELLKAAVDNEFIIVLGLSATAIMSPLSMSVLGHALGLHSGNDWWDWCLRNGCKDGVFGGLQFNAKPGTKGEMALRRIHHLIFPARGCRLRREDLADQLPDAEILVEIIDDYEGKDIECLNMTLNAIAAKEREDDTKAAEKVAEVSPLTMNVRNRQRAEAMKVPGMFAKCLELLDAGYSVVVFLNFTGSIVMFETMIHQLKEQPKYRKLVGGLGKSIFEEQLRGFQSNEARVIMVQTDAGSASIDLHDVHGGHPRAALVSPGYSPHKLIQTCGRVDRVGRQTPCIQYICFSNSKVEKRVAKLVQAKLANLALLNDGDLEGMLQITST